MNPSVCDAEIDRIPLYDDLNTGWATDNSTLPKLSVSDIEKYLIYSSHSSTDNGKMECYRQYIRGLNFTKKNTYIK